MPAILDLPEMRDKVSPLSVEACEALAEMGLMDEKTELIRGILFKKMTKSPLHRKLTQWLYDHSRDQRLKDHVVFQESPLRLSDSLPEPDVMIVRGEKRDFAIKHPTTAELVVEVAVSSVASDRANASLYAEAGVAEYWIVLGEAEQVEIYRRPEGGIYQEKQLYSKGEMLACASVTGLEAVLAEWFA